MHDTLADMGNLPNLGHYRALVDLMGHPELGGKTVLYLVDALFCGYYWDSHPYKWRMPAAVRRWRDRRLALERVRLPSGTFYDPGRTGVRLASLGVHEHWNNPIDKQYSRNLGTGLGIELISLTATRPDPELAIRRNGDQAVLSWQGSLTNFHLEHASRLDPSTLWHLLPSSPVLIQGRHTVTNTTAEAQQLFRLAR